jgi:hypothetical protein
VAAAFVVAGALILAFFAWRGPRFAASPRALTWSRAAPDAGDLVVQETRFGVDFLRLVDADEPMLTAGALRRGDQWLVFDELNFFEGFQEFDGGLYVVGEWATEGGGPTLELLVTRDRGAHFTHLASLAKPWYGATFRELRVEGELLTVRLEMGDELPLPDEWVWPPWRVEPLTRLRPHAGPGDVVIFSRNAGRTWQLDLQPPPAP